MTRYLGLSLMIISFIGCIFFRHYSGDLISYPFLWYAAFTILGLTGLVLVYSSISKDRAAAGDAYRQAIEKAKATAQKIELELDKCEFKNGSFSHQIEDPDLSTLKQMLPHSLSVYMDTTKTETLIRSYLIYNETASSGRRRYISHSFTVDQTTLQYYVMTKKMTLYVDRFDAKKYFFEVKV